jgi:threonine dehydrogenase-like Zn-dependent dehydrogenase
MKALCWFGRKDVRVEDVPEPKILNPRDAILRVTLTAICGSDIHIYDGYIPSMFEGDILGHEFMGEIVETGAEVKNLKVGDRVVIPFPISCGSCSYCRRELWALCDNTNPGASLQKKLYGGVGAGIYGYSHIYGGYAGGQAEYVRIVHADVNAFKVPDHLSDEQVLFLSDIFPTGYMAAENCEIAPGSTVAVWGAGPVGLFSVVSALALGAGKVIAIDRFEERLELARAAGAETIDYMESDVADELKERTGGEGPDACIDAVGMEAHGTSIDAIYDRARHAVRLATDRPHVLRQALYNCRKGGVVSIPGVYGGVLDKLPWGSAFAKGLTVRMGQTHVHRYMQKLLGMIESGAVDPTWMISHRLPLSEAAGAYEMFTEKDHRCTKVVLRP